MEPLNAWNERAARLWAETFEIIPPECWRPDEIELLRMLCTTMTTLDRLEAEIDGLPLLMPGSHGGTIANPLLAEARMHRGTILAVQKTLKLPTVDQLDDQGQEDNVLRLVDGTTRMGTVERARTAARARHGTA